MRLIYTSLCLAILIVSTSFANNTVTKAEKEALLDLYAATKGESWKISWDLQQPITSWKGVT